LVLGGCQASVVPFGPESIILLFFMLGEGFLLGAQKISLELIHFRKPTPFLGFPGPGNKNRTVTWSSRGSRVEGVSAGERGAWKIKRWGFSGRRKYRAGFGIEIIIGAPFPNPEN